LDEGAYSRGPVLRLITIPFSHYCEKARWALDRARLPYREDRHVQIVHYLPVKLARGRVTVPVLIVDDRRTLSDSTDILRWIDEQAPGSLYPVDAARRAEALRLEEHFDEDLGPATRRVVYFHVLPRRDLLRYNCAGVSRLEAAVLEVMFPFVGQLIRRRLRISADGIPSDLAGIRTVFDEVGGRIAGRRYLVGDGFTVADLAFASMAAPVLMPAEYGSPLPRVNELTAELGEIVEEHRRHPAGMYALRLFREDRRAPGGG
jgi:glutathione S-transferase